MQDEQIQQIQVLYTANLGGAIERLPRLYSLMKGLRREGMQTVVLDLGGICSPESWHCNATDGRSMLIVLDGMGYTAANAVGLSPISRQKLEENLTMALIDAEHAHVEEDVLCALEKSEGDGHLCVSLLPAEFTGIAEGFTLYLAPPQNTQVGEVIVHSTHGVYSVESVALHNITDTTPPDATIAGVVDFVLGEARYYQQRRAEKITPTRRTLIDRSAALLADELEGLRALFTAHTDAASAAVSAAQASDWATLKQLCFLISHAANELADALIIAADGVRFERHQRLIYEAHPLDCPLNEVLRLCQWLVTVDDVFKNALSVSQFEDESPRNKVITLTFSENTLND